MLIKESSLKNLIRDIVRNETRKPTRRYLQENAKWQTSKSPAIFLLGMLAEMRPHWSGTDFNELSQITADVDGYLPKLNDIESNKFDMDELQNYISKAKGFKENIVEQATYLARRYDIFMMVVIFGQNPNHDEAAKKALAWCKENGASDYKQFIKQNGF